jgi:hypothetical protein
MDGPPGPRGAQAYVNGVWHELFKQVSTPMRKSFICAFSLLVLVLVAPAQTHRLKTFHDLKYGVTFRYPAGWSSGADVQFYLGSEILQLNPDGGAGDPIVKVGFVVKQGDNAYSGTNLNGVQFVYNVISQSTVDACRKRVEEVANNPVVETVIRGVTYNHFSGGDAGLGHQASREIYSTFQNGNCYLFEEAIHTASMDEVRPLDPAKLHSLRMELGEVMQSVRVDGPR